MGKWDAAKKISQAGKFYFQASARDWSDMKLTKTNEDHGHMMLHTVSSVLFTNIGTLGTYEH